MNCTFGSAVVSEIVKRCFTSAMRKRLSTEYWAQRNVSRRLRDARSELTWTRMFSQILRSMALTKDLRRPIMKYMTRNNGEVGIATYCGHTISIKARFRGKIYHNEASHRYDSTPSMRKAATRIQIMRRTH